MAAANTDKLKKVSRKWVGQVGSGGISDAAVDSFNITSTNLPTDTAVVVVVDRVDANGTATPSKEESITGVVSGYSLVNCVRVVEGTAQAHAAGAVVEVLLTAKGWNDIVDGILVEHGQDGTHASTIVKTTATQTLTNKTLTTPIIASFYQDAGKTKLMTTPNTASDTLAAIAATQTLTNKRITPRVVTATDDATAVIDVDVTDQYQLTAVANATEFTVTGTPVNGQKLIIRLKDAGAGKGLTWTGFTAVGVTLPTTTVAGKTHYIGCIYNSAASTWDAVAVVQEA
jgi:hypothetical protein